MPEVSELSQSTFSRSSNQGQMSDSQDRSFRVLLSRAGESFDIQATCNVRIGDRHPINTNLYCVSFDARFDGDSRMVLVCTFQYQSTPSAEASSSGASTADPKSRPPDVRPANWSVGSSLYEIPIWTWRERTGANAWGAPKRAVNGANDLYDGVTALDAIVTISIQQYEASDPTRHARHVGAVNSSQIALGSLVMPPHTVMLRGIDSRPVIESWGGSTYRGWDCTYEFAYRANDTQIWIGTDEQGGPQTVELGWDVAIPQTGMNVVAFAPPGRAIDNAYGQPLKLDENTKEVADPLALPTDVAAGRRARAMVRVPIAGKSSLIPSAQPIALNDNGRARSETLQPIVRGYQVHRDINFQQTLGLRLF